VRSLNAAEAARDIECARRMLEQRGSSRFAASGAHDPTASRYFVLEKLFTYFDFNERSHLLDVGCANGRVLAYFAQEGFPGRATGVELDPELAQAAKKWTKDYPQLAVKQGDVLELDLSPYSDFYLFNPFDNHVLVRFIEKLEAEVIRPVTVCHMSDNGDNYSYMGRSAWHLVDQGWIREYEGISVYSCAQHWSVWRLIPRA